MPDSSDFGRLLGQLNDATLAEFFAQVTLLRARACVGQVRNLSRNGHQLQALVQGSEAQPYKISIKLGRKEFYGHNSVDITTRCSCPVGNRCKHAAAVLIAARSADNLLSGPRDEILRWASEVRKRITKAAGPASRKPAAKEGIFYLFRLLHALTGDGADRLELGLAKARLKADGSLADQGAEWTNYEQALLRPPSFVRDEDLHVFRLLRENARRAGAYGWPVLQGESGFALFEAALATGRAYLWHAEGGDLRPLKAAPSRPGRLEWLPIQEGGFKAAVLTEPRAPKVVATQPLVYLDPSVGEAGRVELPDGALVAELLLLPPLNRYEVPIIASTLEELAPRLPSPGSQVVVGEYRAPFKGRLELSTLRCSGWRKHRSYDPTFAIEEYDLVVPQFCYGDARFTPGSTDTLASLPDGRLVKVERDQDAEARAWMVFQTLGFKPLRRSWFHTPGFVPEGAHGLDSEPRWANFYALMVPLLEEVDWEIITPSGFRHRILLPDSWEASIEEGEGGWFELSLGIEVDGRRLDLAPMLHAVFRRDPRWLDTQLLDRIPDDMQVVVVLEGGERIGLPAGRLKPLARTLVDLFDGNGEARALSPLDAPRVAEALGDDWEVLGRGRLDEWLERIRQMAQPRRVPVPRSFKLELRPYQREGLSWLQHLWSHDLAGILADDMGLGKTAQTLAHLLVEKRAGRLDKPALVVLPTSLVFNWQREAERYAPDLRVLSLRGSQRAEAFERIPEHDVCLTTYPLLWRDQEALLAHEFHGLILDEAQTVKNAASQAAQVIRKLKARHRLCLTGTPLENHLGELWSQFDFLLPGFLGDSRDFTSRWRTPIEKQGDGLRRQVLARRIAPFILRRRKEEVARDLPPKTIVVRSVELEGRQRDLYETVRASMDKRVREEIERKGLARSQIVILDALLKLRQVCCDPRLLKTTTAARVKERAKLDLLMDMLPELVEEGRKVLVFSQFTGMLELIADELHAADIRYVTLTGKTEDRETPIRQFQEGQVPVFLISLKAGGVGLNLTAADTVIHYDPWWNPAAENQATDRAHRLGQTRAVFVYKLVVAGSIEEKILALQEKKADLAASILSEDHEGTVKFGEDELRALFEPLPGPAEAPKPRGRRKAAAPSA